MAGSLSKDRIEQLAPDRASLAAALKLMKPASWVLLARTADTVVIWGECQGSGAAPYRVIVAPEDAGYKCTCPSHKHPCKHVLAMMWIACEAPARVVEGTPPDWVGTWQARRRPRAARPPADGEPAVPAGSLADVMAAAAVEAETPVDPKAAARAEAQRERARAARETGVLAGLDELDRWILDQIGLGLGGFSKRAQDSVRIVSQRLVDAKAQGLVGRIEALCADLYAVPEPQRPDLALERLATIALITQAYRRQDDLPPALRADVRGAVGWTSRREDLLADPDAPRVAGRWLVIGARSDVLPTRLVKLETWLMRIGDDVASGGEAAPPASTPPHFAVLLEFVPVTGAAAMPFVPGETITGELVYYPSAAPLRALLATRTPAEGVPSEACGWPPAGTVAAGVASYAAALAVQPWLEVWPVACRDVRLEQRPDGRHQIADGTGTLPLVNQSLHPLLGIPITRAVVAWTGAVGRLLTAVTPVGVWHAEA